MKYRPEIDGLRALAVLPVILFHAGFELFSGGYVGVDVFFVISGYLITTILVEDIENKRFSIANFYERRARRILPALFFVMLCCIPFAWMWMIPSQVENFSDSLVAVSIFASNIFFERQSGYFAAESAMEPLLHTWSLAVEEQYYLLFPIFLHLTWKLGKNRVFWMIVIFAVVSLTLSERGWKNGASTNFYLAQARAWEILAGSISAFIAQKRGIQANNAMSLLGMTAIIFAIFAYDADTPFPSFYTLIPVLGAVLIILFAESKTFAAKLLGTKAFVGVGLVSYSAYLWHQPLFAFSRIRLPEPPGDFAMLILAILSIILAYISWRFIEQPFRNNSLTSRTKVFLFSLIGIAAFVTLGLFAHAHQGFYKTRFPEALSLESIYPPLDKEIARKVRYTTDNSCNEYLGFDLLKEEVCLTNSHKPNLLVIGDSKAMALYSGIYSGATNIRSILISAHSCPMYPNLSYTPTFMKSWGNNCTSISQKAIETVKRTPSLNTVLIVNHAVKANAEISRYYYDNEQITNRQAFRTGFGYLIDELKKFDVEIIFVTDVPRLKTNPYRCIYKTPVMQNIGDQFCNETAEGIRKQRKNYNLEVARLAEIHDIKIFDTTSILCESGLCKSFDNKRLLYFDQSHITPYTSQALLRAMLEEGFLPPEILIDNNPANN